MRYDVTEALKPAEGRGPVTSHDEMDAADETAICDREIVFLVEKNTACQI